MKPRSRQERAYIWPMPEVALGVSPGVVYGQARWCVMAMVDTARSWRRDPQVQVHIVEMAAINSWQIRLEAACGSVL